MADVMASGWFLKGEATRLFETDYAQYIGTRHCVACGNGLDALTLIFRAYLRLCDMHGVPIATNIATAEVLLRGLDQGDLDYREGMHPALVEPVPAAMPRRVTA